MDFGKIRKMIEERRILTGFSSYPYLVDHQGVLYVVWFNYSLPEEDEIRIIVSDVFWVNSEYEMSSKAVHLEKVISADDDVEPEIEYDEYLRKVENLYTNYSEGGLKELLCKTEEGMFYPVYNEVSNLLFNN